MNSTNYNCFDVKIDSRNVAFVTLDVPGRPLNVLDRQAMQELRQIVEDFEANDAINLVVFRSGKESGFLAGADVASIAEINSPDEAMRLLEEGQQLFDRIDQLPMPTLAVIHGPCLGGGLEWSLACDHRIARDNSSTQIGLPEIKLGLIPGWGGTQRLPRLVGLTMGLSMILQGRPKNAKAAANIGLIDQAIAPETWDTDVDAFIEAIINDRDSLPPRRPRRRSTWLLEFTALGRAIVFRSAKKRVASKSESFPALASAIRAVAAGYRRGIDGFRAEREEFAGLISTSTCRRLLELFFAREKARNTKTWSPKLSEVIHADPIRSIGVIGGGAMGAGIAQLAALRGFDVTLKEIDDETVDSARSRVSALLDHVADRKRWNRSQRESVSQRISFTAEKSELAKVDLVIEAIVEREDLKCAVFTELDRAVRPGAIFATNTSSLSVDRMAAVLKRPSDFAGLHFFNPVHRMELVEVVRGAKTSDQTIAKLVGLVRALGKTPVVTTDSPGFLVNRVLFPYLGEAILMIREGYDARKIDQEMKRFGMPMGPCELLDQVGLDVAAHVATSLSTTLVGVEPVIEQLSAMTGDGLLGVKSGQGFYQYAKGKRAEPTILPGPINTEPELDDFVSDGLSPIARRLVYPMLAESIRCHQEKVVREPWAIDLAMVLGTGFAPHLGGPLHLVDAIGHQQVLQNQCRLRSVFGKRFAPPKSLFATADRGLKFFGPESNGSTRETVSS